MTKDLEGITMIDLAGMGPSARCVRALADLGARWLRLRPPGSANRLAGNWHAYGALRGAEEIEFDLKHPRGAETFLQLVREADVMVEGFRPGVADRLGIGYAAVSAVNPGIVYCAATGHGQDGPLANAVGHDINYQALSGALSLAGKGEDGLPALPAMTLADSAGGGWQGAMRVLAALMARTRTGMGQMLDISATEGVMQLLSVDIDETLATGRAPVGSVLHGGFACYAIYGTADGEALALGAIEPKFFRNFCAGIGQPELAGRQFDRKAQPDLRAAIAAVLVGKSRDEWVTVFDGIDACLSPVLSVQEALTHPQAVARGLVATYAHPKQGMQKQLVALGGVDDRGPPPAPGCAVLSEFGFSEMEVADVMEAGPLSSRPA